MNKLVELLEQLEVVGMAYTVLVVPLGEKHGTGYELSFVRAKAKYSGSSLEEVLTKALEAAR